MRLIAPDQHLKEHSPLAGGLGGLDRGDEEVRIKNMPTPAKWSHPPEDLGGGGFRAQDFGPGNCGREGIQRFFGTHVCNPVCHFLKLPAPRPQPPGGTTGVFLHRAFP